jgi:hypothetical protein
MENAQFNTMLCKGRMNFARGEKKMAETAGAVPATMPGPFRGRAPGKSGILYHRFGRGQLKGCRLFRFPNGSESSFVPSGYVTCSL